MTPLPSTQAEGPGLVRVLLAAAMLCTAATPLDAQDAATGVIRGTLRSGRDEQPVAYATVTAQRVTARSDASGRFLLPDVPVGTMRLAVRALGYRYEERSVVVARGETTTVVIFLEPAPVRLDPVRTTARAREREEFERSPDVGTFTLRGSTLRQVPPIGEPDVLRSVQLLPGVVARSDYTAGYNVRGGEADQNLILLDGIPVYNPFHLLGLFGTFIDETVADVNLMTGGFPSSYGSRLSSVLDVATATEARQGVHGSASVSMLSTSAMLGGTLPDAKTSWSIAGRRTYIDALAAIATPSGLPYDFWDGQLKAQRLMPNGGTFSVTAYAGRDTYDGTFAFLDEEEEAGDGTVEVGWGNRLVGLSYLQPLPPGSGIPLGIGQKMALGDSASIVMRAAVTEFDTGIDLGAGSFVVDNTVTDVRASGALTWFVGAHARRVGVEGTRHGVLYDARSEQAAIPLFERRQHPYSFAGFWDDSWRAHPRVLLRYGARVEHLTGRRWTGVSPRASIKLFATPDLAVTIAGGRYAQWMHSYANEDIPIRLFDAWMASDAHIPVSLADHAIVGAERWFGDQRFVRVEAWGKKYTDVAEQNQADDPAIRGDEFRYADGLSYGGDILLRQVEGERLSGWLSYGYAVSARERDGRRYAPAQDRRHTLNAVVAWQLPRRWQLGSRIGFGSGTPFTDIDGQIVRRIYNGGTGRFESGTVDRRIEPVGGDRNGERYPAFIRFDITASRRYDWGRAALEPYLSVINATNRQNVFIYTFDYTDNPPTRTARSQFPILPTLGLTVRF